MPRRLHILANEQTYHVFNRTVGHEIIFTKKRELQRIIELTNYYRFPQTLRYSKFKLLPDKQKNTYLSQMEKRSPLIQLFAFAFMPNHYHFLIRQNTNRGISIFISNIQNSFAKFFNIKNERHGTVFQNPFKARRIEREEEFLHVSRYIHLNPVTSYNISISDLPSYPWTSMP
ncbi:transposase, partial [Candidatus Gottesmanbacteria bacterium]|nr:transposase [Candidatus Gottesmanbacteria bacterium]